MAELTFDLAPAAQTPDFRALLGADWWRLPACVRQRFEAHTATVYEGTMEEVRCSLPGLVLAQVCRLLGTPLVFRRGRDVPARVSVYPTSDGRGMVWSREYGFSEAPLVANSVKTWHPEFGLMECVTGGLGMLLEASVEGRSIEFVSCEYFLRLGGCHFRLPAWLTPGRTHVIHRDLGAGQFVFELRIESRWLGETFFQRGTFADPPGRAIPAGG